MARRRPAHPTWEEHERLKAEFDQLRMAFTAVREQVERNRQELATQFQRIAEMQAVLDEERMANHRPTEPRPLIQTKKRPA